MGRKGTSWRGSWAQTLSRLDGGGGGSARRASFPGLVWADGVIKCLPAPLVFLLSLKTSVFLFFESSCYTGLLSRETCISTCLH